MTKGDGSAEFDAYTANYNAEINKALSFSGMDIDFFARVKNDYLIDILDSRLGTAGKVELLDVGCGIANAHKQLVGRVGKLAGVDVSSESIAVARQNKSYSSDRGSQPANRTESRNPSSLISDSTCPV